MKGPFLLPSNVKEGDYIEIGNAGAYGRAIAGDFNGYGQYEEVILTGRADVVDVRRGRGGGRDASGRPARLRT